VVPATDPKAFLTPALLVACGLSFMFGVVLILVEAARKWKKWRRRFVSPSLDQGEMSEADSTKKIEVKNNIFINISYIFIYILSPSLVMIGVALSFLSGTYSNFLEDAAMVIFPLGGGVLALGMLIISFHSSPFPTTLLVGLPLIVLFSSSAWLTFVTVLVIFCILAAAYLEFRKSRKSQASKVETETGAEPRSEAGRSPPSHPS
jgi:hypothetical protein